MGSDWRVSARRVAQRAGIDPRNVRRMRWLAKAQGVRSVGASVARNLGFVLLDPEPHNYTYALANIDELERFTALVCRVSPERARAAIAEVDADFELRARVRAATARHRLWSKREPPFGRRAGWYAVVRLLGPELVIETGVHDGLGSLLLLRALERNAAEGRPGRLVSFDINPNAGWLVAGRERWELRIEASRDGLEQVLERSGPVGVFVHDSLHTYDNEHFELSTAARHLAPGGVLITDNAHVTGALRQICAERGFQYLEFGERPRGTFYPGSAMGAGVPPES